jgi:hypothetical protein
MRGIGFFIRAGWTHIRTFDNQSTPKSNASHRMLLLENYLQIFNSVGTRLV